MKNLHFVFYLYLYYLINPTDINKILYIDACKKEQIKRLISRDNINEDLAKVLLVYSLIAKRDLVNGMLLKIMVMCQNLRKKF